eukprot:TRINITY_DN15532_c0_g1_i1.p1 TRINITY_DN15532_c0_g1~~TRINITY_DN15532_c0_g1_i1.p1  ORF type:complete len:292 (+),score=35.75 TRINITY_DN15532_c0_g1_i1:60-878(+)
MARIRIGILGGTGLEDIANVLASKSVQSIQTPFGAPSDVITLGNIDGVDVALLARHGSSHAFEPSNVNYRANIWALKSIGCTHVLAATACGSLRQEIRPGDFVIIDQFIDRTVRRSVTFYDGSSPEHKGVCHIPMGVPFCSKMRAAMAESAKSLGLAHHPAGTMVTIEGPRFSTRAESEVFRQWNCDVINMTTVPEAQLCREAGMCYAAIAMATDYDSWRVSDEPVSVPEVLAVMRGNADRFKLLMNDVLKRITHSECHCMEAIHSSVMGGH